MTFEQWMMGITVGCVLTWAAFMIGEWRSRPKSSHCHRDRLCRCTNGKRRCEKCNWVPEDND